MTPPRAFSPLRNLGRLLPLLALILLPTPVLAYVGPGAGLTMLGALWAVIVAIVLAVGGLIVWPLRALQRRRKVAAEKAAKEGQDEARDTASETTMSHD